jgi:hypothetical protein
MLLLLASPPLNLLLDLQPERAIDLAREVKYPLKYHSPPSLYLFGHLAHIKNTTQFLISSTYEKTSTQPQPIPLHHRNDFPPTSLTFKHN